MDKSALRKLVNDHCGPLMQDFGLPHWTVTTFYDLRDWHDGLVTKATCTPRYDYCQATINFDPETFEDGDEKAVLKTLRHELFHIVLSPFNLLRRAAVDFCQNDPVKLGLLDTVWDHVIETGVIHLERMYHGLTHKEPACTESIVSSSASSSASNRSPSESSFAPFSVVVNQCP